VTTQGSFNDEQARAIIARAIELDHRAPTMSVEALRAVAADVGISPASLERAMREQAAVAVARRDDRRERMSRLVLAAGGVIGAAAAAMMGDMTSTTGFLAGSALLGLGIVASASLVVLQGPRRSVRSFLLRNLALWGSITAGALLAFSILGPGLDSMPALVVIMNAIKTFVATGILGTAGVLAARTAHAVARADGGETPPGGGAQRTIGGRVLAVVRRMVRAITHENSTIPRPASASAPAAYAG
jgi:hypothetical protein